MTSETTPVAPRAHAKPQAPSQRGTSLPWSRRLWLLVAAGVALLAGYALMDATVHSWRGFLRCSEHAPRTLCAFFFPSHSTMFMVVGAVSLLAVCRRELVDIVMSSVRKSPSIGWIAVHLAGLAAVLATPTLIFDIDHAGAFWAGVALGVLGVAAWMIGAMAAVVTPTAWLTIVQRAGSVLVAVVAIAFLAKPIASAAEWIWYEGSVAYATFHAVAELLTALGFDVITSPEAFEMAVGDFGVIVDRQCSGIEGFVLITSFLALYGLLFREHLRLDRYALLFPIGIAISWCFNVVRISSLIAIGANGAPELAINGFHSHAGWLAFLILSLSLALVAHNITWFRRAAPTAAGDASLPETSAARTISTAEDARRDRTPFFEDLKAAEIVPFFVFMVSALLASTFSETPSFYYPLRFAMVFAALWAFRRVLARIDWRPDPLSLGVGAAIGVAWVATAPAAKEADVALTAMLAAASTAWFVLWVVCRILGTAVLVPIVEELFFRGYILRAIDVVGAPERRVLAILVSAGLFAFLHDRWLAAGLAGLIFGLLALRRDRIADPIYAHATANAVIAAWAASSGDWSVI